MNTDKLRRKILNLAVEGKLINQNPCFESADDLLKRLSDEKKSLVRKGKNKISKSESNVIKGDDGIYYEQSGSEFKNINDHLPLKELPNNWAWTKIDYIAFVTKLAGFEYTSTINPNLSKTGIPLFKGKNVQNGKLIEEFESYIPENVSDSLPRSQLNKKAILVPYVGTIGNAAIFDGKYKAHLGSNVGKIEIYYDLINNFVLEEYVLYYLMSSYGLKELTKHKKATAQDSISIDAIRDVLIAIPPFEEQKMIVEKIKTLFSQIDNIDENYSKIEILVCTAKKRLLENVFSEESFFVNYYSDSFVLGDVLPYEQPGPFIVSSSKYSNEYKTPVLTPGKSFILGYTNEQFGIYHPANKVIIFDDFTTASRLIDFDFKVKSSAMKILHSSDDLKFNIDYLYYLLQTIHVNSDTHKRFWISEYATQKVRIHTYNEQLKIVEFINKTFKMLDELVM